MVLIETVGQKTKIRDSETSRPKIRESETQRNTGKRDFEIQSKRLQDFEIGTKVFETLNFPGTIRHPFIFRVKWIVFVSRWCYKSGPLKVIGQLSHDGIGIKTRVLAGFHFSRQILG